MRYLFIVGSPFCGSTIAGNVLNSHPDIFHAGEVDRLRLFNRYQGADATYLLDGCALCGLDAAARCPVWDDLPPAPADGAQAMAVYQQLMARGGKAIAVDGSKNADWLAHLHDNGLQGTGAILFSRNPLAFARSHQGATGASIAQGVEIWRNIYNHALRVLLHRKIPFLSLRHEEMTGDPERFYARILDFAGLAGRVDREGYFAVPTHAMGGNVGAFLRYKSFDAARYAAREAQQNRPMGPHELAYKQMQQEQSGPWQDTTWMRDIPDSEVAGALAMPGLNEVMSLLGYAAYDLITAKQRWQAAQAPKARLPGLKWLAAARQA